MANLVFKALKTFKWTADRTILLNQAFDLVQNINYTIRPEVKDSPSFCALIRNNLVQIIDAPDGTGCEGAVPLTSGIEVLSRSNKDQTPFSTSALSMYQQTGIQIALTPAGDGDVEIYVNGITYPVCDGDRTVLPFYFSNDAGVSARLKKNIQANDSLYVNGPLLGFGLNITDYIDLAYMVTYVPMPGTEVLVRIDKNLSPNALLPGVEGQYAGVNITESPVGDGYVQVTVNGITYSVGDAVKTKDFYFSNDGGVTARSVVDISAGDGLYMNCLTAGFALTVDDRIDLRYVVEA